jgi:biotin-(acetyl-CoA carboxylase) ligase
MNDVLDMLEKDRVLVNFRAKDRDFDLVLDVLPEVDSTNRYMLDEAVRGAMTGSACLARTQTAGRGRRGKSWLAPVGNIYLSLLWRFNNSFESVSGLSLVAGAAVAELVASYAVKPVALKWPNDVLCDGKQFERHGLEAVLPRWNQFDILAGREVVATASQGETRGIAKGIDATGALLIEVDGVIHRVLSGDVSLRLAL